MTFEALDLIASTVEAGATPQAARKWWGTELARNYVDRTRIATAVAIMFAISLAPIATRG